MLKLPWTIVKVLLVFGDKYGVDEFRQEGLRLVEAEYPKKIMDWGMRDIGHGGPKARFGDLSGLAIVELVGVARKLRLRDVYLAALYDCCNLDAAVLVDGVAAMTGDTPVRLEPRDLIAVLNARTALRTACTDMPKTLLAFPQNPKCATDCWWRRDKVVLRWIVNGPETAYDPLAPIERQFEDIARDYDICSGCLGHYRGKYMQHRQAIRNDLEDWMDIEINEDEFGQ